MKVDDDVFVLERRRKIFFAVIGIALIFSLVSASAYSASSTFANLNDEIKLMETDMHNLQNILDDTHTELNQSRNDLNQSIEERCNLQDQLNTSIGEKATLQITLDQTKIDLLESIEQTSTLQDNLKLTSPPTAVTKINCSRMLTLINGRFNLSGVQVHTMDRNYSLTTKIEMERFLSRDLEIYGQFEYVTEVYDCDDFALRTYGELSIPGWSDLAVGILVFETDSNTSHMTLLFFDIDEKIWMIDYFKVKEIPDDWVLRYLLI